MHGQGRINQSQCKVKFIGRLVTNMVAHAVENGLQEIVSRISAGLHEDRDVRDAEPPSVYG